MMFELSLRKENQEVMKHFLNKDVTSLGRSSQNDVCLPDPAISRVHLVIVRRGSTYIITDKSSNGTFVNEERIISRELKPNDVIRIGQWSICFQESQDSEESQTEIRELIPTRILSYRPRENVLISEKALLEVLGESPKPYTISKPITSIGKSITNDIVLSDEYISNFHCKVENRNGMFFLKDLQSTNGTFLNQQKIIETSLPLDSIFEVGKTKIRFYSTKETHSIEPSSENQFEGLISFHPEMKKIFSLVKQVARSDSTILIEGETGTGKELIARAIHNQSNRALKPYIVINCSAISKDLMESELFGHEKGAFTSAHQQRKGVFEQAQEGTLFLDEIGDLPLDLQPKLLRVLESGEIRRVGGTQPIPINVRIVAATNRNLAQEVQKGRFREDLFFRLFVIPMKLIPLRERTKDIPFLVQHFLEQEFPASGSIPKKSIDASAMDKLMDHSWPGNVRELRNVLSRAVLACQTGTLSSGDIEFAPLSGRDLTAYEYDEQSGSHPKMVKTLKEMEKEKILTELEKNRWNKKNTAKVLGIAKSTLHEKIKKYGLNLPSLPSEEEEEDDDSV